MIKFYLIPIILFLIGLMTARWVVSPPVRDQLGPSLAVSFAAIMLAGMFAPAAPLFLLVCVSATALSSNRTQALCRYVLLVTLAPLVSWRATLGGLQLAQASTVMALSLGLLVAILARPGPGAQARPWSAVSVLIVGITALNYMTGQRDLSVTAVLRQAITITFEFIVPALIIARASGGPRETRLILGCLAAAGVILTVIALYEARFGWSLYEIIVRRFQDTSLSLSANVRGGLLRAPTSFEHPIGFAFFQMIAVLAALADRSLFRSVPLQRVAAGIITVGMLTGQSRGAVAGLFVGLIASLLYRRRTAMAAALGSAIVLAGSALWIASSASGRIGAFLGKGNSYQGHFDYRAILLRRGFEEGMKSPIYGSDIDVFFSRVPDLVQGQQIVDLVNTYLYLFIVSGLLGLGFFVGGVMITYAKLLGARMVPSRDLEPLRLFAFSALSAALFSLAFAGLGGRNLLYLVVILAVAKVATDRPMTMPAVPHRLPPRPAPG